MSPRPLLFIVAAAFLLRLFLFGYLLLNSGEAGTFLPDSRGFYRTATNIAEGHGFSRAESEPFTPSAYFPPIYPLAVAGSLWISNSVVPIIFLQIILASLIPLLVWKIGTYLTDKRAPPLVAAGLSAFEPLMILWSIMLLTEVISVFTLLLAFLFFMHLIQNWRWQDALLSSLFLGLSTLTRPHAQYLFILAAVFLLVLWIYNRMRSSPALEMDNRFLRPVQSISRAGRGNHAFIPVVFIATFLLTLSPWLARNYYHFGTINPSTTGLRNIYSTFAPALLSLETGRPYGEVQDELLFDFARKHNVGVGEAYENPALGGELLKEGLRIVFEHPKTAIKLVAIDINAFFTQDLYTTYLRHFNVIPRFAFDFSPSVVLVEKGPVELGKLVWERLGIYSLIPLSGRVLWILITLAAIFGAILGIKKSGFTRIASIIISLTILYYMASSLPDGFGDFGRHRYPANPFIFLLASYGLWRVRQTKFRRQET